jgi:hypothetical protein
VKLFNVILLAIFDTGAIGGPMVWVISAIVRTPLAGPTRNTERLSGPLLAEKFKLIVWLPMPELGVTLTQVWSVEATHETPEAFSMVTGAVCGAKPLVIEEGVNVRV